MILLHRLKSLGRWVFRRGEVERQLHDELESFIDLTVKDKIRDGVAPDEARRLARLVSFENLDRRAPGAPADQVPRRQRKAEPERQDGGGDIPQRPRKAWEPSREGDNSGRALLGHVTRNLAWERHIRDVATRMADGG